MTNDDVKKALLEVLKQVQTASGLASPTLQGQDIPSKVLPKFDSTVWPAATTWLANKLDVVIPHDVHIFGGKNGAPLLTIEQTAALVLAKHLPKAIMGVAAE